VGDHFDGPETSVSIIHKGNIKDPWPNEFIDPATQGNEYWQLSVNNVLPTTQPSTISKTDPPIPTGKALISLSAARQMTTRTGISFLFFANHRSQQ